MSLFLVRLSVEKGILSIFFSFFNLFYCFTIVRLPPSMCTSTHEYTQTHTHTHTHTTPPHHNTHTLTPPPPLPLPTHPYLSLAFLHTHCDHRIFCGGNKYSLSYNNSFHSIRQINERQTKSQEKFETMAAAWAPAKSIYWFSALQPGWL